MIASRVFSNLLKHNPNAARMMLRQSHEGVITRNPYPRAGPNPFGEPEWFANPVHRMMKKVMVAAVVWVIVDVRYLGEYRACGKPFTIQMINSLFPSVPARYANHPEGGHH